MSTPNVDISEQNGLGQSDQEMLRVSLDSKGNPKLILYSYRWIILLLYCMANISVGMIIMTVVPIVP
jgi:hypothetical protein